MTKLTDLRALLAAATEGPWFATWDDWRGDRDPERADRDVWTVGPKRDTENWATDSAQPGYGISKHDAALIAALRNNADALLDVVEAARLLQEMLDDQYGMDKSELTHLRWCLAKLEDGK